MTNPFRETIVASPWNSTRADVPEIHGRVFDQCLAGIGEVRGNGHSQGLLIHGEAGSGKTHLLRRLREHLMPELPSATDREECLFVWVRLQTSPRMIWRTLRRTLVDDWFRPIQEGHSQFQRILFHRLAEYRPAEWDLEPWYEYMLDEDPDGLVECLNQVADSLDLDRNTATAFAHIAFRRHLRDLRAWLAGSSLPEETLRRMDFTQDEGTDEEREDESRRIVLMLCKLAGDGLPIVLSFDQVEALQMRPGDHDALFAFGQLISTLHDGTSNVLLVSCVQSAFATELKTHVRGADHDRMTDLGMLSLDPLDNRQAKQLIAKRLEGSELPAAPWPLDQDELDVLAAQHDLTPRRLLNLCAERIENEGRRRPAEPPVKNPVESFLNDSWDTYVKDKLAGNSADETEEIVRHGLPLLAQIVAPELELIRDDQLPDVSVVFEGPRGYAGIAICAQSNMSSLAKQLKRLQDQLALNQLRRLVIVRDSRMPLTPGAKLARQRLDELERHHAVILHPTTEALAALDALRALLSDAKSGELACQGETISPLTVEDWINANLTSDLREFIDEILGRSTNGSEPQSSDAHEIEVLNELLARNPNMPLKNAAEALRQPVEDVAATVRRHPGHFRLLGEPPALLFRAVESSESPV